jgi:hypothetical protein
MSSNNFPDYGKLGKVLDIIYEENTVTEIKQIIKKTKMHINIKNHLTLEVMELIGSGSPLHIENCY